VVGSDDPDRLRAALAAVESENAALRRQAEEYRRETQLRVRNMLSLMRSLARRTAAEGDGAEEWRDRLDGRLASFARAQAVIFRTAPAGVDLELLVADELLAFGVRLGAGAEAEGDPVSLAPRAASVLGLAFHELGQMAVEGGATLGPGWSVAVRWRFAEDGTLLIDWAEAGRTADPGQADAQSFGRAWLEQAVAYELGGSVRLDTDGGGLCCRLRLPPDCVHAASGL
jgi:two-component system, chemotaxis family, CheB/CheR fusion protein